MIAHPVVVEVASHTAAVERGEVPCDRARCPRCEVYPGSFKYHARRQRQFLVIIGRLVREVISALTRWKCPCCGQTFTLYPSFALPHKQYVRQDIARLAQAYVGDDKLSYRKATQVKGMAVCYGSQRHDDQQVDDRVLGPSTLHRWVGWLGSLKQTLQQAWRLIRSKSPTCDLFRKAVGVPGWKYRCEARRDLLQRCCRLLKTNRVYQDLFDLSIFTELATVYHWR